MLPYNQIDAVLRKVARELPRLPDWWPQFLELTADADDEHRLKVYQAVRDEGTFEEHEGDFLVCFTIDQILTRRGRVEPQPIDERMTEVDELYRLLAPDRKPLDETSPLEGQPLGTWQELFTEQLKLYGESELADLFRRHPGNLMTAAKFGQIPFFGSPPEGADVMRGAVQTLYDEISECVSSDWPMGPLRLRWDTRCDFLTLTISPTPIERVGGANDGQLVDPALSRVDLIQLPGLFSEVSDFYWSVEEEERKYQCLCLWGNYRGCLTVMLTLYAGALEGDKPTLKEFQRKRLALSDENEPDDE